MARNLLKSLFTYRPRVGMVPEENFLTEAFAHVLESSEDACRAFVAETLRAARVDLSVDEFTSITIKTQETYADAETGALVRPDMLVICNRSGGTPLVIYSENKWKSPADPGQLDAYRRISRQYSSHSVLLFIGESIEQRAIAAPHCDYSIIWETVFEVLSPLRASSSALDEFLEFLDSNGLSPHVPLSLSRIAAYSASLSVPDDCFRIIKELEKPQYEWSGVPESYRERHAQPSRWGRVGLEFYRKKFSPQIFIGLLHDPRDHALTFVDQSRGIDLVLFIECLPASVKPKGAAWTDRVHAIRQIFRGVTALDHTEIGGRHRKLTIQECLADVIIGRTTEVEQASAIYARIQEWLTVLFEDGTLLQAMKETWPDE